MMKSEVGGQCQQGRHTEGMRVIFDQATPCSSGSLSRSSSSDSSYTSSESSSSSHRSHHRSPRYRSSSSSSSRTRSRSHPRCHWASGHSHCRRRAQSRSFSPSPDCSSRSSYRIRSRSSSWSSRQRDLRRRSRSCSPRYRRGPRGFVGRYRCRFSPSTKRCYRDYRSRSRSPEYSSVRLSHKEKMDLLNIAKENAAKLLGVRLVELPASVSSLQQKPDCTIEEGVREDRRTRKRQAQDEGEDDEHTPQTSPTRKPITFSINNTVAKPSSCASFQAAESKVTSRADSMGNRKPYGHWVPVNKTSPNKSRLPVLH